MIWKFTLIGRNVVQTIQMPRSARVLSVMMQDGSLCVWVEVDPRNDLVTRRFATIGTGIPMDDVMPNSSHVFVGSVVEGPFVWHVYDLG